MKIKFSPWSYLLGITVTLFIFAAALSYLPGVLFGLISGTFTILTMICEWYLEGEVKI